MRTVSAIEVRRHFGRLVDEAAAGERLIIERAGQPVAAIVPLSDVAPFDPDQQRERRLRALQEIRRAAQRNPFPRGFDAAQAVRQQRDNRADQITRAGSSRRTKE